MQHEFVVRILHPSISDNNHSLFL